MHLIFKYNVHVFLNYEMRTNKMRQEK